MNKTFQLVQYQTMRMRHSTLSEPHSKQEAVAALAAWRMYPAIRGGEVRLQGRKRRLTEDQVRHIIDLLEVRSLSDCEHLRKEIRAIAASTHRPIREWIEEERPREMLARLGPKTLPPSKLLAIIIRTGKRGTSAEDLARRLLNEFGSLRALAESSLEDLRKIDGIGLAKAAQLKAAFELGKRLLRERAEKTQRIKTPADALEYVRTYYGAALRDSRNEVFSAVLLDARNKPIHNVELSRGTVEASIVDPREIIRQTTLRSASAIILVHNHPSGDPEPSKEDIEVTKRIVEACRTVGIRVLDHLIVGKNPEDYWSFASAGMLS